MASPGLTTLITRPVYGSRATTAPGVVPSPRRQASEISRSRTEAEAGVITLGGSRGRVGTGRARTGRRPRRGALRGVRAAAASPAIAATRARVRKAAVPLRAIFTRTKVTRPSARADGVNGAARLAAGGMIRARLRTMSALPALALLA